MGCCGQKRALLRRAPALTPMPPPLQVKPKTRPIRATPRPASAVEPKPSELVVRIHYTRTAPIRVRGPATRREYACSAQRPVQTVDVRNAQALLRGWVFRPA